MRDPRVEDSRDAAWTTTTSSKVGPLRARPAQRDRRLVRDERQRHELGEAAGLALEVADGEQVPGLVPRLLDVPEHHRRRRAEADAVRRAHDLEPLCRRDLVGAQDPPHLVIEDLGRGARQRAEPRVLEAQQVVLQIPLGRRGSLPDLERRERVHVDRRYRVLHGTQQIQVPATGESRMDPALQADLGAAALPRLDGAPGDLVDAQEVGGAAEVLGELALGEGAEAAA